MNVGDLVSVIARHGKQHMGIIIDLYEAHAPDGEAQILWDDGNIHWEMLSQLQLRTKVINA